LSAFILAAGVGQRLSPITRHIPKPLLPILGKTVLETIVEKIASLPIEKIGINLHHKRISIERWARQSVYGDTISLFPEEPLLGTGGALKNAEDFLKNDHFIVHNADIVSHIDLRKAIEFHSASGNLATLVVHNHPDFNALKVDSSGFLVDHVPRRKQGGDGKTVAFTGIAVYHPRFLEFLPMGASNVVDAWLAAVSAGHRIGTYDVTGTYWTDIGTPSSYARAIIQALRERGETIYIDKSVRGCASSKLSGYVVLEKNTVIENGAVLKNCIALPGAKIEATSRHATPPDCFLARFWAIEETTPTRKVYQHCLVGPGIHISLDESDFCEKDTSGAILIGAGGSDRRYYRVMKNGHAAVLMKSAKSDPDFERQIALTTFFDMHRVPVPHVLDISFKKRTALFRDLGDVSLYSWLQCSRSEREIAEMYRMVIDVLALLHTTVTDHARECEILHERIFDYEHLRWETGYFLEWFVRGVKQVEIGDSEALESDFHRLASLVDSFSKTIVHRDFQSQNIMIDDDGRPSILDYQGARMGPPAYDVVSLLWDPYHRLGDLLRESLLEYYLSKITDERAFKREFRSTIVPCRLQRHMQALGAYGFLSMVKGKAYFKKYIPEGTRLLKIDASESADDYPELFNLVMRL